MNQLLIMQKTYDMMLYVYPALKQFPRSERHQLVADIKQTMFEMTRLIARANKARRKLEWLWRLDAELTLLRTQVRLAHELGFLPPKKYEVTSRHLAEVGKLLGGWIRANRS